MSTRDRDSFGTMCRTFPVRTGLFSVGPILIGLLLLANGYVNGGSLAYAGALFLVTAAFAVLVTRLHLASFRVRRVSGDLEEL